MLKRIAAYNDEAAESIRNFWPNIPEGHVFKGHPILDTHGQALSQAGFDAAKARCTRHGYERYDFQTEFDLEMEIAKREAAHKAELEQLAKSAVAKAWNIPKDRLNGSLGGAETAEPYEPRGPQRTNRNLKTDVDRRLTLNTLTQGAALHGMQTLHHLVDEGLKKIDPELPKLYARTSALCLFGHWHNDYSGQAVAQEFAAAGDVKLQMKNGVPTVQATALWFPILVEELVKGVVEMLTAHAQADYTEDELRLIFKQADKLEHEFHQVQVGTELWRRFLAALPPGLHPSDAMHVVSKLPPQQLHQLMELVVQKNPQAVEQLRKLAEMPEGGDAEERRAGT